MINHRQNSVNKDDRDRRLQITGSNQVAIETAKRLIVDTIRRNASPVPPAEEETDKDPYAAFAAGAYGGNQIFGQQPNQAVGGTPYGGDPYSQESTFKKGLQKSSSLGITLKPKADGLFSASLRPAIYDADDVIYMSSNNSLLLNEAVHVLSVHMDQRRKQKNLINSSLISNNSNLASSNLIKQQQQMQLQQQMHQQMLRKKRMNLLSGPPTVGNIGNMSGNMGSGLGTVGRFGSNSYDDLMRPNVGVRSQMNLDEEDEECEIGVPNLASTCDYKYFDMAPSERLNRIKSVLSSNSSTEQMSPLFGDFVHRDSFDLNATNPKSGLALVKAVKKSASSNTIYSRQTSANLTPNTDDLLINLDTSSPWSRASPLEPLTVTRTFDPSKVSKAVPKDETTNERKFEKTNSDVKETVNQEQKTSTIRYDKLTLIKLSKSDLSRGLPNEYENMKTSLPDIMI